MLLMVRQTRGLGGRFGSIWGELIGLIVVSMNADAGLFEIEVTKHRNYLARQIITVAQ
jgi:hypothetical protein